MNKVLLTRYQCNTDFTMKQDSFFLGDISPVRPYRPSATCRLLYCKDFYSGELTTGSDFTITIGAKKFFVGNFDVVRTRNFPRRNYVCKLFSYTIDGVIKRSSMTFTKPGYVRPERQGKYPPVDILSLSFEGYDSSELDSVLLTRYQPYTNFTVQRDSFFISGLELGSRYNESEKNARTYVKQFSPGELNTTAEFTVTIGTKRFFVEDFSIMGYQASDELEYKEKLVGYMVDGVHQSGKIVFVKPGYEQPNSHRRQNRRVTRD